MTAARELRGSRRERISGCAIDAAIAGVIGGIVGAKLLWAAEHAGEEPLWDLILSRGSMSWFGGFADGLVSGVLVMIGKRIPVLPTLAAAPPALAIGHAVGRIGCFLVGDDYGRQQTCLGASRFRKDSHPRRFPFTRRRSMKRWRSYRWHGFCSVGAPEGARTAS